MRTPRVTAIIPAYNAASYLPQALTSVSRQSYQDWEAVVVDDGSTDSTRALVESYMPVFGGRLRYVYQANRGLPAARNTAMRHARGEIFALLDADDIWLEHRLEASVAAMDVDPAVGLVHARVTRIDSAGNVIDILPRPSLKCLSGRIAKEIYTHKANIACATATFRRACVERVGNFDETMRATEDRDMWFRIAEHFSVAYVNDTVSQYRVSPNSMSSDLDRMWNSQMYFLKKHLDRGAVTRSTYREALATVWRDRGDVHFRYGTLRQAIYCHARSVGALPFDPGNWYPLILAVGVPVARALPAALLPERVARLRAAAGRADLRSTDAEAISIHNRGGGNFIFH